MSTSSPSRPDPIAGAFITLDELQRLAPAGTDIVSFLDAAGIAHGGGLVSRLPVERVLGLRADPGVDVPAIDVLRRVLDLADIELRDAKLTRGWRILISARKVRRIFNEALHGDDPRAWPAVELATGQPVEAKLYLATKRHLSAAHFLVSGLDAAPDGRLFFFVCVPDSRIWIATRRELLMLEKTRRKDRHDGKKKFGRVGAMPRTKTRRALRLWFPIGSTTFDAEEQFHDARGERVLKSVERGGRRR